MTSFGSLIGPASLNLQAPPPEAPPTAATAMQTTCCIECKQAKLWPQLVGDRVLQWFYTGQTCAREGVYILTANRFQVY